MATQRITAAGGSRPEAGYESGVIERWYKEAVIYCLDVHTFQDSNGDGVGDLPGLISRLDYLARLGVTCLWLNPVHPTPHLGASSSSI